MNEHKAALGHENLESLLARFEKALALPDEDEFKTETSIKLFEIAYELSWKTLRNDLLNDGRIVGGSPRAVFKAAYDAGWIKDSKVWVKMLEDRNVTVHTYREDEIKEVEARLPTYLAAMRQVHDTLKDDF